MFISAHDRGVVLAEKRDRTTYALKETEDEWAFIAPDARYPARLPAGSEATLLAADATRIRGFYRRTDADTSFLTAWAILFERDEPSKRTIVERYETYIAPMHLELSEKRQGLLESSRVIAELESARGSANMDDPALLARHALEVGVEGPEHRVVGDHQHRPARAFQLDDHRVEAQDDVLVRFPARIAVGELVALARLVLAGQPRPDLRVAHAVADAGVDLVERAPRPGGAAERGRGLDGAAERAGPDHDVVGIRVALIEELGDDAVDVMRTLKRAMDPLNLFNPGKIFSL